MCYGRSVEALVQKGLALLTERTEKVGEELNGYYGAVNPT